MEMLACVLKSRDKVKFDCVVSSYSPGYNCSPTLLRAAALAVPRGRNGQPAAALAALPRSRQLRAGIVNKLRCLVLESAVTPTLRGQVSWK